MKEFIKGLELCEKFYLEICEPILKQHFPNLKYSVGLKGYGSDVLGFDDEVSRDHMWGPRLLIFLKEDEIYLKDKIFEVFAINLPYEFYGISVNFTEPDINDNGVRHAKKIKSGNVNPLIFIKTFDEFLNEELGTNKIEELSDVDWLTISEHRLLSIVSGKLFIDDLKLEERINQIKYYPENVRKYLVASNWDIIASEQAFLRRCYDVEDEIGSIIITSRIVERLMRLCFLYEKVYAPYSKWFGKAFTMLNNSKKLKEIFEEALHALDINVRENKIVEAQKIVADLHNESNISKQVKIEIEKYYGRDIKVIHPEKFAEAIAEELINTEIGRLPLIGTFSSIGGLSSFSDEKEYYGKIKKLYE